MVSTTELNYQDMVVDFKALKLAVSEFIDKFDHSMSLNASDPLRESLERVYPGSVIVFEQDPTTEVLAQSIYKHVNSILTSGVVLSSESGARYEIPAGKVNLDRVRVWETESSWAEYEG